MTTVRKRRVTKPKEALKLMGGPTKVGRWWGISHSAVCDMAKDGISGKYGLQTYFYLQYLGYRPSPSLFGLKNYKQLYPPWVSDDPTKPIRMSVP